MEKPIEKKTIDNTAETVLSSTATVEKHPPRLTQELINVRRLLKGVLEYVEPILRNQGVKL